MFKFFIITLMLVGDILYIFEKFPKSKIWTMDILKKGWSGIKAGAIALWNKIFKKKV